MTSTGKIRAILRRESNLFKYIKIVAHYIITAVIKMWKLSWKVLNPGTKQFHSSRRMTEEHALEEIKRAEDGPLLEHAAPFLKKAMNSNWKGRRIAFYSKNK